ncbi:ParB/RepB/Spo0J family partition protein [Spirochaetota bacterium]
MPILQNVSINSLDFKDKSFIFRHSFNVEELKNSIKFEGLLHPIILKKKINGGYTIVAGYRRALSCKDLDGKEIKSIVYDEKELSREEFLKISIAENTKRQPLMPVEIADALVRIREELDLTIEELAAQFGETFGIGTDTRSVEKYLRLNLLDSETKDFIASTGTKDIEFEIADIDDDDDRKEIINFVRNNADIRKGELHKVIESAKKIRAEKKAPDFGRIFGNENIRSIMTDEEMNPKKKINHMIDELGKTADPALFEKRIAYSKLLGDLDRKLEDMRSDIRNRVHIKKREYGTSDITVTMNCRTVKDLIDIVKVLYEQRNTVIKKIMEL